MKMHTQPLFFEDVYKALGYVIERLGGYKEIGHRLWPEKSLEDSRRLLLDCMNSERPQKLNVEQVMAVLKWAREIGCDDAKHFIDLQTGYEKSAPANPRDELSQLQRQFNESVKVQTHLVARMERLTQLSSLSVVKDHPLNPK